MRPKPIKSPRRLKGDGRRLWQWLCEEYDISGADPLVLELCCISHRLAEVRASIAKDGVSIGGKKNPLVDVECKLSAQFVKLWRCLGLADKSEEQRRPIGRPTESERWRA